MISGQPTRPLALLPGDIIHLEPHQVGGVTIGRRELDVEVTSAAWADTAHELVVVGWHSCPDFPGARPRAQGVTVYGRRDSVPLLWHRGTGGAA